MKKWIIPAMLAIIALLMPMSIQMVSAQNSAGLSLSKSAEPTTASVGDNITYTYTITNTDNFTINNISLEDDLLGSIDLGGQNSLDAGGTVTATAVHTVAESDLPGPLINTATVSGSDPDGNTVTVSATATVELSYVASLQLTKVANPTSAAAGDNVTYTYTITNNGPVNVSNITLTDVPLGTIDLGGQTSLDAGKTITATATYTVVDADLPGPLVNTATVSGTDPNGKAVTATATATVELTGTASLQVTKNADRSSSAPHQTINYTYTITNNGNVTIDNLSLKDDKLGAISLTTDTLAAGESTTGTASYTVTISDLPGPIVNTATVTGTGPDGQEISATSNQVSVSLNVNLWELFKSEILKLMGVPGKGIENAPGLQKPFNPKSQAAEHHGATTDNVSQTGTAPGLQKPLNPKWQESDLGANTGNVTQTKSEILKQNGVEGKGINTAPGLQKPFNPNSQAAEHAGKKGNYKSGTDNQTSTDNQTGIQGASDNGHKPDKDRANN
jgi:uncharacterized repeat protein (TIGR01451 family)